MYTKKKQFRLYDIYRYATIGVESKVRGIREYECNKEADILIVTFENDERRTYYTTGEEELRKVIKSINKKLGNCHKPGRRKK